MAQQHPVPWVRVVDGGMNADRFRPDEGMFTMTTNYGDRIQAVVETLPDADQVRFADETLHLVGRLRADPALGPLRSAVAAEALTRFRTGDVTAPAWQTWADATAAAAGETTTADLLAREALVTAAIGDLSSADQARAWGELGAFVAQARAMAAHHRRGVRVAPAWRAPADEQLRREAARRRGIGDPVWTVFDAAADKAALFIATDAMEPGP